MIDSISVLYAEDSQYDIDLTLQYFEEHAPRFKFVVVETGELFWKEFESSRFDLILLDNNLPDTDGVDVLKELLSRQVLAPIVMVTGRNDEELAIKVLRLGATDFISKHQNYLEFMPAFLERVVEKYKRIKNFKEKEEIVNPSILYVEDNPIDVDLTKEFFKEEASHFKIEVCDRPTSALEKLKNDLSFDVVLVDLNLVDMSGIEFIRELAHHQIDIPVIVITGAGNEDSAIAALQLGAYDYVLKEQDYLHRLPHRINNALVRFHTAQLNDQLHEKLANANAQLEEKNQFKSMFIASMSHELRTPLTSIMGFTGVLLQGMAGSVTNEQKKHLEKVMNSSRHLNGLINDIIDSSKIDAGIIDVQHKKIDVSDVLDEAVESLKPEVVEKGLELRYEKYPTCVILSDKKRVMQSILNLVSNAMKYTEEGFIEVYMEEHEQDIFIRVKDSGIGISSQDQKTLFKPFVRANGPLKGKVSGTGLGLYLTKKLVEETLNGEILFESKENIGSVFTVRLPKNQ